MNTRTIAPSAMLAIVADVAFAQEPSKGAIMAWPPTTEGAVALVGAIATAWFAMWNLRIN